MNSLTKEQKLEVAAALTTYLTVHKVPQAEIARRLRFNAATISLIASGNIMNGEVEISDKHFRHIAEFIGYNIQVKLWPTLVTPQFATTISLIDDAKTNCKAVTILGNTGLGKSHAVAQFVKNNPMHTYLIVVNSEMKLADLLSELLRLVGGDPVGSLQFKMMRLAEKLRSIRLSGGKPVIILDEMENASLRLIRLLKSVYDVIHNHSGIVLIGTEQYQRRLLTRQVNDVVGIPQFCRRFKAGTRYLPTLDDGLNMFFAKLDITDKSFKRLLLELCTNYGELHDYLEPVLRTAHEQQVPVTEYLFRLHHNLPNHA